MRVEDAFLGALIHDVNLVNAVLARCDTRVARIVDAFGDRARAGGTIELDDGARWTAVWLALPRAGAFREHLAVYAGDGVRELEFPAPYALRRSDGLSLSPDGRRGAVVTTRTSWREAYERQLRHFHAAITGAAACRTPAEEGLARRAAAHRDARRLRHAGRDMTAAIVTGSDSGIGRATAVALAHARASTSASPGTRDEAGAHETARRVQSFGARARVVARLDLTTAELVGDAIDELADALGGLDALVNNAGANHRAPVSTTTLEGWRRALEVNLTGPFLCAQAAARRMSRPAAAAGSSTSPRSTSTYRCAPLAPTARPRQGSGCSTKVLALELAAHGITVNAVAPGHIATPMTGKADRDPTEFDLPQIPLGRPGGPDEVAEVIALFASGCGLRDRRLACSSTAALRSPPSCRCQRAVE